MKVSNNYLDIIKIIQERKLSTWKEIAFDLGIAYATILRHVKGKENHVLSIKTKKKMREYIHRNLEYLVEEYEW